MIDDGSPKLHPFCTLSTRAMTAQLIRDGNSKRHLTTVKYPVLNASRIMLILPLGAIVSTQHFSLLAPHLRPWMDVAEMTVTDPVAFGFCFSSAPVPTCGLIPMTNIYDQSIRYQCQSLGQTASVSGSQMYTGPADIFPSAP